MGWLQGKRCLSEPGKIIKFVVLFLCGIFTIHQVSECVEKLRHPPVSTHYLYLLNDTIGYPSLTICRRPAYKTWLFHHFGMRPQTSLESHNAFQNFRFDNFTISDFMNATTYRFDEIFKQYGFAGRGSNPYIEVTQSYHLSRGKCYTLEPLVKSETFSVSGGYFFYLTHTMRVKDTDEYGISLSGFPIFLHDPSEILTYKDDQKDSFLQEIYLESAEDMNVVLDVKEFHKIPTREYPCIPDENYSKSKCQEVCIHLQVARTANCTLPWLILPKNTSFSECNNYTSVRNLIRDFRVSRSMYIQNCKCPMACNITLYGTSIINRKAIDQRNAPSSIISLYYSTNLVTTMKEIAGYDWNQFVSDVGGSLGFLLGLSVLSLICLAEEICRILFKWMFKRKIKKREKQEKQEKLNSKITEPIDDDGSDGRNNTTKKQENMPSEEKHDYKYLKDFATDYRVYENNLFDTKIQENKKY